MLVRARGKRFLGYRLERYQPEKGPPSPDDEVWISDLTPPGEVYILMTHHSDGTWSIRVDFAGYTFTGSGVTERKARITFKNRLIVLKELIKFIEKKVK